MKISFIFIGKTQDSYLQTGIQLYNKRLLRYNPFQIILIPNLKNRKKLSVDQVKEKEGELLLKKFAPQDFVILLDERGKQYSSIQFSEYLQRLFNQSMRNVKFVCGGAYGFSNAVYQRANAKLSLSKMTLSHQMIRLFFLEQLYRAFTILNNEPYHHE